MREQMEQRSYEMAIAARDRASDDIVAKLRSDRPCTQFDSAGRMITFDGTPTDLELAAANEIEWLRKHIRVLIDGDPMQDAADTVTVLDIWRKEALEHFGEWPPSGIDSDPF